MAKHDDGAELKTTAFGSDAVKTQFIVDREEALFSIKIVETKDSISGVSLIGRGAILEPFLLKNTFLIRVLNTGPQVWLFTTLPLKALPQAG